MHCVKTFVPCAHKSVNVIGVPHFVVLAPVVSKLELCLFRIGILSVAVVIDYEGHVSAVFSVETQGFEVGFNYGSGPR